MKHPVMFYDDLSDYSFVDSIGNVVHILCISGSMSFLMNRLRYKVTAGDFVIFLNGSIVTDIRHSEDFKGIVLIFSESFYYIDNVRNNYTIIGQMSLLNNPVMNLSEEHFNICLDSLNILRDRCADRSHIFHDELIGALLKAHILELLNIHAKIYSQRAPKNRPAIIMTEYIVMLEKGEYVLHRNLAYYAEKLCITPHYLSEVSKDLSGQPATYWIEKFTIQDILKRLMKKGTTLSEIADRLNFTSISYLSRFIKKQTGRSPSDLQKSIP